MTEEEFNEGSAAGIVVKGVHVEGGEFMFIGLLDENGNLAQELDRNLARAVAYRLLKLADDAPPPRVILPSRGDRPRPRHLEAVSTE